MYLDRTQDQMLCGEHGETIQKMMRLLVRLGEIYSADKMIPVGSVQVAGVSYKSIKEPGTQFLEDMAKTNVKVKVLTTLNPAGMDLQDWEKLGFPKDFAKNQQRIIKAFEQMGVITSTTCTPYLAGNLPRYNEHLAWSESSAVSFANSVIGARTNREGGPSALASALCGFTPNYGLHLTENRAPSIHINVEAELSYSADYGLLGYNVGKAVKNKIPYFTGLPKTTTTDNLKALGAAMAATGAVALYHAEDITPEATQYSTKTLESLTITQQDLKETHHSINSDNKTELIVLGCPHASLAEIRQVALKLKDKKLHTPIWICTSRTMKDAADHIGYTQIIENAGGHIVADTCMVVSPIEQMGYQTTAVNSGKAAQYLPGHCKQHVVYADIDTLIDNATS